MKSREELLEEIAELKSRVAELSEDRGKADNNSASIDSHFASLVKQIPLMIFVKRAEDLSFVLLNKAGEELLGLTEEEVLGKSDYDIFPKDQADFFTKKDREVLSSGDKRVILEEPISVADGVRWLSTSKIPLRDEKGNPRFLVGISEDITEKKKIEERLRKSKQDLEERVRKRTFELEAEKERLNVTLRAIREGVIATDAMNRIRFLNDSAREIIGWNEEDARGKRIDKVFKLVHGDRRMSLIGHELYEAQRLSQRYEVCAISRVGTRVPVYFSCSPISDHNGIHNGWIFVFRDISFEIEKEQDLLRTQKLESVGQLAGGIAHDFNNLLAAIMGNVSLAALEADEMGAKNVLELMETTEAACLRAKGLTQQLLTFSKGGQPIKEPVNIEDLLEEASCLALGGSSVTCAIEISGGPLIVNGDPGQLLQVLNNLFINAKQAMPNGGELTVQCRKRVVNGKFEHSLDKGTYIEIAVQDCGVGIDNDTLQRVFEPYFTTRSTGTGLGLATSYSIVVRHGGHIQIDSTVGEGTVVTVLLPASTQTVADGDAPKLVRTLKGRGRVLLMDDDEIVQDTAGRMIEALGYEVRYAWEGKEAIAQYAAALELNSPFDAVILDLTIKGGLGGKETAERILQLDPRAKLIVSSGYSSNAITCQYQKFGFLAALAKPYGLMELSEVLSSVINDSRNNGGKGGDLDLLH
ncbi:MAG: PAS domain-containing protein [Bdellovibrionales bacterium]|nr:PAS domain-containing protein [Bdellovibrionales bacterium]